MKIGEASNKSGVSVKMIRYYESIGLLCLVGREENGYRTYCDTTVRELSFIQRARALGFPLEDIKTLLSLWRDEHRPSREARKIAAHHLERLEARITDLKAIADLLKGLVTACHGDDHPACPILDNLGGSSSDHRPV